MLDLVICQYFHWFLICSLTPPETRRLALEVILLNYRAANKNSPDRLHFQRKLAICTSSRLPCFPAQSNPHGWSWHQRRKHWKNCLPCSLDMSKKYRKWRQRDKRKLCSQRAMCHVCSGLQRICPLGQTIERCWCYGVIVDLGYLITSDICVTWT